MLIQAAGPHQLLHLQELKNNLVIFLFKRLCFPRIVLGQVVVTVIHAFNFSTREAEAGRTLEFDASLVYKASRTARTTQRNPVLKNKQSFRYYYHHMGTDSH